jgi:hypothetical protein
MTLLDLKKYHQLRADQCKWLDTAKRQNDVPNAQGFTVYWFLLLWADAMHEADAMLLAGDIGSAVYESRGAKNPAKTPKQPKK